MNRYMLPSKSLVDLLLKTSRPRFWMYLIGPAILGVTAALQSGGQASWMAIVLMFVFTFPANLFIYGVNDIFDGDTDRLNPKKQGYESLLPTDRYRLVLRVICLSLLPFLVLMLFLPSQTLLTFFGFFFLGAFYSAPPIRSKARPFIDAAFNSLYLLPGLVAWYAFGGGTPDWKLVLAGCLWCAAMHAYSAVPDIEADRSVKLNTIATKLGAAGTLMVCVLLYSAAGALAMSRFGSLAVALVLVYIGFMALSTGKTGSLETSLSVFTR